MITKVLHDNRRRQKPGAPSCRPEPRHYSARSTILRAGAAVGTVDAGHQLDPALPPQPSWRMRARMSCSVRSRHFIQTPGGLITREVPLRGDLGEDIQLATVASAGAVAGLSHQNPAASGSARVTGT